METHASKNNSTFDVTMDSYNGTEVCELFGLYILDQIKEIFKINDNGLYRDDCLIFMKNLPGPSTEQKRKKWSKSSMIVD